MRPQVWLGIGIGIVGLGLLAWLGRGGGGDDTDDAAGARRSAPGRVAAPSAPDPASKRPEPGPTAAPISPESGSQIPRALKKLVKGDPAPGEWMDEIPEVFAPDAFADAVEDILLDCESEHRVVDVTCDEAPCMVAWVAPPDAEHPSACYRWATTFGSRAVTRVGFDVDCPNGRRVRAELATSQEALLASVAEPDAWNGGRMAHRATGYTVSDWCE